MKVALQQIARKRFRNCGASASITRCSDLAFQFAMALPPFRLEEAVPHLDLASSSRIAKVDPGAVV